MLRLFITCMTVSISVTQTVQSLTLNGWEAWPRHLIQDTETGMYMLTSLEVIILQSVIDPRQVPEGSGEQGKMEKTGCKIICGAPTTLAVKGLMMMMKRSHSSSLWQHHSFCKVQNICYFPPNTHTHTHQSQGKYFVHSLVRSQTMLELSAKFIQKKTIFILTYPTQRWS